MLKSRKYIFSFFIHLQKVESHVQGGKNLRLVQIDDLLWTYSATTSKKRGMTSHNKDIEMEFNLKNFEIGYNTFFLVFYKSLVYMQVVFNNYNYSSYKEYMKVLVTLIEKRSNTGKINVKSVKDALIVEAIDKHLQGKREMSSHDRREKESLRHPPLPEEEGDPAEVLRAGKRPLRDHPEEGLQAGLGRDQALRHGEQGKPFTTSPSSSSL